MHVHSHNALRVLAPYPTHTHRCSQREADDAPLAMIELVDREGEMRPARVPPARMQQLVEQAREHIRKANDKNYAQAQAAQVPAQ